MQTKKKDKAYTHVQTAHSAAIINKFTERKSETRWSGAAAVKHALLASNPQPPLLIVEKTKNPYIHLTPHQQENNFFSDTSLITTVG